MATFTYHQQELFAEQCAVRTLAEHFGTPLYIYSRAALEQHYRALDEAFGDHPHLICYAVKANSNLAVLDVLAQLGAGFDIVSVGELERVLAAGGDPHKVVFSGVGKTREEIGRALDVGIHCFNVESAFEIDMIQDEASARNVKAPVALRVNPDVDAQTHPYISTGLKENKFGVDINEAVGLYRYMASLSHLDIVAVDCHIGSQLTRLEPFEDAIDRVLALVEQLAAEGIAIRHLDLGGGLGVRYTTETPPTQAEYVHTLLKKIPKDLPVHIEPGRSIAARAGIFVTQVIGLKPSAHKNFAVVDGAMNDLIRPTLYGAVMDIIPVQHQDRESRVWDVVGPVCETGDFLGKDRELAIAAGDLLAVTGAGAYGFVMASNYNSRNRPPEVMVDGDRAFLVRRREVLRDQLQLESRLL